MSRTVLLSEVNEVAARYPEMVKQIRATFAGAHLPFDGEPALHALTERLQQDALFRDDLHETLSAALTPVPQITQLGALAVLLNAAVGPEQAVALAESEAADLPLRALFKFVLASRRRSREAAVDSTDPKPEQRAGSPLVRAVEERDEVLPEAMRRHDAEANTERHPAPAAGLMHRELLTTTVPGDSGMLGRALAFAADHEPAPRKTYIPEEPLPLVAPFSVAEEPATSRAARRERTTERVSPRNAPSPATVAELSEDEEEELDSRPRRWGMGTAVMCGVLIGFAVGAFVHFDHKAPADAITAGVPAATQLDHRPDGKVKSVEELSAEIAALDSLANAPTPTSYAPASRPDPVSAPRSTRERASRLRDHQPAYRDHTPLPPAEDQHPAAILGRAGTGTVQTLPSQSINGRGATFAAPVALTRTASASATTPLLANNAGGSVLHAASTLQLPHVVTGSAGIMAANLVSSPAPAYPAAASAAGVQGDVVVEAVVGRGGEVVGTRVVSGPLLLRTAALEAVQHWHYRPYEVDGKPVEIATTAHVEFRLDR